MLQHLLHNAELQKLLILLIPAAAWILLFLSRTYSIREYSGSFLAYVWQMQATLVLNIVFPTIGLWQFSSVSPSFYGIPLDFIIGQAITLGAVNFLLLRNFGFYLQLTIGTLALYIIYGYSSIVITKPLWSIGVSALSIISLIPSLLLAKWTAKDEQICLRSSIQSLSWACLLLWFFPASIFQQIGHSWTPFVSRPLWLNVLFLIPLILPAAILLSALRQFAVDGNGTAFPYDPPKTLVTSGVYAYLSNPMQLGICLLMAWWGVVIESYLVSFSSIIAVLLFIAFKDICNGSCAIGELDPNWVLYQKEVPKWIPRITRWQLPEEIRCRTEK
jgi:protein-S-isoprenylcysteine O-methyltransferase Ste14